jgi:hypothetical protein
MAGLEILFSGLVGGVTGAGLTALVNWLLKEREYQHAYYKEIMKKRLAACDALEDALKPFLLESRIEEEEVFCHNILWQGADFYFDSTIALNNVHRASYAWVSARTYQAIREILDFTGELEETHNLPAMFVVHDYCVKMAKDVNKPFRTKIYAAYQQLFLEYKNAHRVKEFLDEEKSLPGHKAKFAQVNHGEPPSGELEAGEADGQTPTRESAT